MESTPLLSYFSINIEKKEVLKMTKTDFIDHVHNRAIELSDKDKKVYKYDAEFYLGIFLDVLTEEMKKGEKVQLVGFGTFEVSERAAREGRNPQTGKTMKIEACKAPKFKAGKALKDAVNA